MRESTTRFTPDVRNVLELVLTKSSKRMVAEGKTDREHMEQAKVAISKLLNRMVDIGSVEYEISSKNLNENFNLALKGLCPIWPIC